MLVETVARELYAAIIRGERRLPVPGLIKRYLVREYDDFGNSKLMLISSAEQVTDGQITYTSVEFVPKSKVTL